MRKQTARFTIVLSASVLLLAGAFLGGCGVDREVFDLDDNRTLRDYIEKHEVGRELFALDILFPSTPYTKFFDPGATFRDYVDSTLRDIQIDGENDVYFGFPWEYSDFAEVFVTDQFLVRTERYHADSVSTFIEWKALSRSAFFLRLGSTSQSFQGWVLHGFNGGYPRLGLTEGVKPDGSKFFADGREYDGIDYLRFFEHYEVDSFGIEHRVIDTLRGSTRRDYVWLEDVPRVSPGDSIIFRTSQMDGATQTGTIYQLLTAETDDGFVVRSMSMPDLDQYIDTLAVPGTDSRLWNLVLFREIRKPDRFGATWVTPYRFQ